MSSSFSAARMELAPSDLLSDVSRPVLRVISNEAPLTVRADRPRTSFEFRRIVIRDPGFKPFRVF